LGKGQHQKEPNNPAPVNFELIALHTSGKWEEEVKLPQTKLALLKPHMSKGMKEQGQKPEAWHIVTSFLNHKLLPNLLSTFFHFYDERVGPQRVTILIHRICRQVSNRTLT